MATELKLPELEENIESGTVTRVLVSSGDHLEKQQPVIELETEKAVVEIPSELEGEVAEVLVEEGEDITVGQPILRLKETGEEAGEEEEPEEAEEKKPKKSKAQQRKQRETSGDKEDSEEEAEPEEQELEDEKEQADEKDKEREDEKEEQEEAPERDEAKPRKRLEGKEEEEEDPVPAAPSVRRLARELDVDLRQVEGSGPGGRITADDVQQQADSHKDRAGTPSTTRDTAPRPLPDFTKWGEIERQPMSRVRRETAAHLTHAWRVAPHVTQFDAADITNLEKLRQQHAAEVEEQGGKLTLTVFLVKAVAGALKAFPNFNASLDIEQEEIVLKKYYHVGVAVETDRGLLVPVLRDVDRKNVFQLAGEMRRLIRRTRQGKLTLGEMRAGNFTVSNSGAIGGRGFTPVLHWPEVAILGVAQARTEPVFMGDQIEPRLILPLALSYDHRVIDGADGVRFLRWIARALEEPLQMLLRG